MKKLYLLLALIMMNLLCRAQFPIAECLNEDIDIEYIQNRDGISCDSRNGYVLSPHGALHVLLIFAEIEYDINPENDPNPSGTTNWPVGTFPVWKDTLFDATTPNNGQYQGLVSQYFNEASFGDYNVWGDYLIKGNNNNSIFKIKESDGYTYTRASGNNAETILCNKINQEMNNTMVTAHGENIGFFDIWTTTEHGEEKITPSIDNPHKFDYVIFIWRNRIYNNKNMNNTGYTSSGSNLNLFGYGIDYCMNIGTFSKCPTTIIRHEYAHGLLGHNNFHTAGGGKQMDYFIPFTGGWSLLGLSGSSLQCCNAWDRYRLGWKPSGCSFDIGTHDSNNTNYVNGDLNTLNVSDTGVYYLRDFIQSGDAIRIKLPYIDSLSEYQEYLWLENHTGSTSNFDKWQYEQNYTCVDNFSGGLMSYIQIDKNTRTSNNRNGVFGGHGGYTRPLIANGFCDRLYESDSTFCYCVYWDYTNAFIRDLPNPFTGGSDEEKYAFDRNHDDSLEYNDMMDNFIEKTSTNIYLDSLFTMGHNSHIFTINGNNKIGISTNPSTATMMNMVRPYNQQYQYDNNNLRTTYLNGISIEILEQNVNGDIKVRVRFDDVDIDNNVRWCSDSIVLNEIATPSGYSLNVKRGKTITLDQGLTATRMTDPITFNGQKIFASPTTFTVQPDVRIHIDTAASIVLENSSKLHLRDGALCRIEDEGFIDVKSGTVFQMDDCSSLNIRGNGLLIVRDSAELRISNHAYINANGTQNIIMGNNVIIPEGYANPLALIEPAIDDIQINNLTVWNGYNRIVRGIIKVNTGATLRIESSFLRFKGEDCGIIVDRGGKLIVDGSTLTTLCHNTDYMWKGIEVWGNRNQHQFPLGNGQFLQGFLQLKNGATIENAQCAVMLDRPGSKSHSGGIIRATDAVFRNNATSVVASPYTNHHPVSGVEVDYYGNFKNCSFIIDDDYCGSETFSKHINISGVNGIAFQGCDFSVIPTVTGVSQGCMGIYANNAGFNVTAFCEEGYPTPCPDSGLNRSTFTNFNNGIYSSSSGNNTHSFLVENSIFINNTIGIFADNTGFATIVGNEFDIKNRDECNYGIYANNITDFCIEENSFTNNYDNTGSDLYGIGIFNSESINDIYLNSFDNLTCGNLAFGVNHVPYGNTLFGGLTYSCNDNFGNDVDFCVLKDHGIGGIDTIQGSATLPAGNTFTGSVCHFYNDGDYDIKYYHNSINTNETPDLTKIKHVILQPTTYSNNCDSHYGGGGNVIKSPEEIAELAKIYQTADDPRERYSAAGDIVRSYIHDSIVDYAELRTWFGNMNTIYADRMAIASFIHEGNFDNAFKLADALPTIYGLQGSYLSDHNDYISLLNLYQSLYNSNRDITDMTSTELSMVESIAENGVGNSKSLAKAIVREYFGRDYNTFDCPTLPGQNIRGMTTPINQTTEYDDFNVSVNPSPATTWATFEYHLPNKSSKATITIINSLGVKVLEFDINDNKGNKTIDLRDMTTGVYLYVVKCGDNVKTGRLVITK